MADSKTLDIIDPNTGESQTVTEAEAPAYLSSGYEVDTPAAKAAREKAAKFGTTGQQLATGAEGFASGATLGLSHLAETALGVPAADIAARKETNPDIAGTTEAGGLVGSLLVPGLGETEGAKLGLSAATAVPRATDALGKGVGSLAKRLLQGLGMSGEGLAAKTAASAADLATQAEVYNFAQNVDETHLAGGNMQQAAENALASSGNALVLGAGLGALLPVAGVGLKLAAAKAGQALSAVADLAREKLPALADRATDAYANVASPLSGRSVESIKEDLAGAFTPEGAAMRERKLRGITADERNKLQTEFQESLSRAYDATQSAVSQGFKELRPEETALLTQGVPIGPAARDATEVAAKMQDAITAMRAEKEIYNQGIVRKLEIVHDGLTNKLINVGVDSTHDLFEMMNDLKSKALDPIAKFGANVSTEARDAITKVRDIRAIVKAHLENSDIYGEAAARQAAFNDAYNTWKTLIGSGTKRGDFQRFFMDRVANKRGGYDLAVSPTKINTYFNKVGAARDASHSAALNDFLQSSHSLMAELGRSAQNVGNDVFDKEGVQSLINTAQIQNGSNVVKLQDAARQRALANGPFVTSSPLQMVTHNGSLATAGAVLGGAPGAVAGAALGKAAQILTNPHEAMRTLSMLESLSMKTSRRIVSGVKSGMKTAAEMSAKASGPARALAAERIGQHEADEINQKHSDDYQQALKAQTQTAMSPPNYSEKLALEHPAVNKSAPRVSAMMAAQQAKIQGFLGQKFPRDTSPLPPLGRGVGFLPSKSEWNDYQRVKTVATKPMTAVKNFRDGRLSQDEVQVMSQLWPNILGQMRQAAAEAVEKTKEPLTNHQLEQLETLFGQPVDVSQTPDFQSSVQQIWQQQAQEKAQAQGQVAQANAKWAQDFMTPDEKLANR